jgi:hypothetical protein
MLGIETGERNANPTNLDALAPPESGSAGETDVGGGGVAEPGVGDVAILNDTREWCHKNNYYKIRSAFRIDRCISSMSGFPSREQ